jgi:uncharacterized protein (TIGR03084 family)
VNEPTPQTDGTQLDALREDLNEEQRALDDVVARLSNDQWHLATSSPGWSVADQIGHLAFFDAAAANAIHHPEGFDVDTKKLYAGALSQGFDEYTLGAFRTMSSREQLNAWRCNREALDDAARSLRDGDRVVWYGPSMGAASFLTARLMETWAHGTDVVEALGVARVASERLRHIAQLGYMTRRWSYVVRGEEPPDGDVRLELTSPSGETWTWGDENADDAVRGSAEDFCLVVTQRRHLDDTSLETSELGRHWLLRAQAFAGSASHGPQRRSA